MLPLGVIAYPSVGYSTTPLRESPSFWKRSKTSNPKKAFHRTRRPSEDAPAASLQHSYRQLYSPVPPPASSKQSSPTFANHTLSPIRSKHVPIVVPRYVPIVAPLSPAYSAEACSPRNSISTSDDCPSLSKFPVPTRRGLVDSPINRPRHVEIVIPDWALPIRRHANLPSPTTPQSNPSIAKAPFLTSWDLSPASMARQTPNTSRTNTIDSQTSAPSPSQLYTDQHRGGAGGYASSVNNSSTSLNQLDSQHASERIPMSARTPGSGVASSGPSPAILQTAGLSTPSNTTSGLSGLVCNVHRTTGREPHPLVGATTTILGDKLYVFGGRRLSRTRPQLTADLYELDLVKRHWTKLEAKGDVPPPRYFHSVCPLGDTKLVCYGGMSPAAPQNQPSQPQGAAADVQPEVVVMSDVHIFDVPTRTWMHVATLDAPQGRYAHCATILPSSATFTSAAAPLAAIRHNPSSGNPNQGSIGVQIDGEGGAEMVVVGGQDSSNHYIEQISVFNLRSLKWTATNSLGRSCGAYRSVVAPLTALDPSKLGEGSRKGSERRSQENDQSGAAPDGPSSMLIYSNYNFLDVKLELQVRHPDGTLTEKPMHGNFSPPGLRFPNGGVINNHFVVSGTFLTSSKQEYALWALDLRTLSWSRIDTGGSIFSQGSWNRGVLWNRRNCFVILGNRKRSLVDDYNHRRINFSNICVVELEAFGLYDNPRHSAPNSAYVSISSPRQKDQLDLRAGGRQLSAAATALGQTALGMRELSDMDLLAMGGERIPVNSRLIARRWGPYFNTLLRDSTIPPEMGDTATLRPTPSNSSGPSRNSSITITPSIKTNYSAATTLTNNTVVGPGSEGTYTSNSSTHTTLFAPPDVRSQHPSARPRTLYLPHTHLTIQALIHYLYTSSLPPPTSQLCSPQILCSLLQLARPYRIDGLLEAIIERLHVLLDGRNTAAIFNAAAMAAGGGDGIKFYSALNGNSSLDGLDSGDANVPNGADGSSSAARSLDPALRALRINTDVRGNGPLGRDDEVSSATSTSTSASASESGQGSGIGSEREIWAGEVSAVVGLQKRGLRGLMEGRRIREMGRGGGRARDDSVGAPGGSAGESVGLGLSGA